MAGEDSGLLSRDGGLESGEPEGLLNPEESEASAEDKKPAEGDAPAEDKKPVEGGAPAEDKKPAEGAPEKYEDFTLPEGVEVDAAQMESFGEMAKGMNLSQENAQKLIDFHAGEMQKHIEAQNSAWTEVQETWKTEARADKEIGGEKLEESLALARQTLKAYGTPELFKLMADMGLSNHVEFIRFNARIGKDTSEDRFHGGEGLDRTAKSPADILFGKTSS